MKICRVVVGFLSLAVGVVAGSPVLADGDPACSISPSRASAVIDPAFFALSELPDFLTEEAQALFRPALVVIDTANTGGLWARFSLTIRGETYRDDVGLTPMFFPPWSGEYPSALGWATAFFGSIQYLYVPHPELFPDFPTLDSLEDAFLDPRSYPITVEVEYSSENEGETLCSLAFEIDVAGGNGGPEIDLDYYVSRVAEAAKALPDTV